MLAAGLAMIGYVAYQVWGTGLATAAAQSRFRTDLTRAGYPESPEAGEPIGFIRIPRLAVDIAFIQGIDEDTLERGPGHYPGSALPGEGGNVAIAGHRTTYAAPFWALDTLVPGDHIALRTAAGEFLYRVVWEKVLDPGAVWVVRPTEVPSLTLTTCNPRFRGTERLVIRAEQIYGRTPDGFIDRRSAGLGLGGRSSASGPPREPGG